MRKKQNKQELVEKRKVALELLDKGKSASEVAEIVSVTIRSIFRRQEQRENPPKKSERSSGRPSKLTSAQLQKLEQELLREAYAHEYVEDYWTRLFPGSSGSGQG